MLINHCLAKIAAWSKFQLVDVAPSLGGSNLNIQIQGHFKKMDSEFSAVDSFVKTRYTFLDHKKRFLVICFTPTLPTFINVFRRWMKFKFSKFWAFRVFEVTQELLSEHVSLIESDNKEVERSLSVWNNVARKMTDELWFQVL